ncbi:MAG: leucine-rich repeat domain-containing protein [Promethearchaeota archaeon]|jgi:Leucine-rich repeat (LRR) protein
MELSPKKIYKAFLKHNLDKPSATKLLLSLIENSESEHVRIESIEELIKIGAKDVETFKLIENLLISDSSDLVRNLAAKSLRKNFLFKSLSPMKWALIHETSTLCLKSIYLALVEILRNLVLSAHPIAKSLLLSEVETMKRKEFKIGFEILCEEKRIDDFTKKELSDILIDYYTLIILEKSYWRLKYETKGCKITELDFIFKGLSSLPEEIKHLVNLKTLILRYNQLTQLPEWLGTLNSLEILNINVNNLNNLPNSIGKLKSLKNLFLWKNELNLLPNTIGNLSHLELLNLRLNQLKFLPPEIGNLLSLKELNLHDNRLSEIPCTIGNLNSLEVLNLSWNNLLTLPKSITSLNSLKILDLERNELNELPEDLRSLKSLEFLNLSQNQLKNVPESIGYLSSLRYLNLSRNNLDNIPKSIKFLTSLKELYVGENNFDSIPKSLQKLKEKGLIIHF